MSEIKSLEHDLEQARKDRETVLRHLDKLESDIRNIEYMLAIETSSKVNSDSA